MSFIVFYINIINNIVLILRVLSSSTETYDLNQANLAPTLFSSRKSRIHRQIPENYNFHSRILELSVP